MSPGGGHMHLYCGLSREKKETLLGYDFAHGAINHASTLMKAVIVDKLG